MNSTNTCQSDGAVTTTAYRFVSNCTSAHWEAIGSTSYCYPSSSSGAVGCACGTSYVNPGCSAATCWRREIAFTTALLDPGYGRFSRINHCISGQSNTYTRGSCSSYGDPTSIGLIADSSIGSWSTPVYLCQWYAGTILDQFFTLSMSECTGARGSFVAGPSGGSIFGYVRP